MFLGFSEALFIRFCIHLRYNEAAGDKFALSQQDPYLHKCQFLLFEFFGDFFKIKKGHAFFIGENVGLGGCTVEEICPSKDYPFQIIQGHVPQIADEQIVFPYVVQALLGIGLVIPATTGHFHVECLSREEIVLELYANNGLCLGDCAAKALIERIEGGREGELSGVLYPYPVKHGEERRPGGLLELFPHDRSEHFFHKCDCFLVEAPLDALLGDGKPTIAFQITRKVGQALQAPLVKTEHEHVHKVERCKFGTALDKPGLPTGPLQGLFIEKRFKICAEQLGMPFFR